MVQETRKPMNVLGTIDKFVQIGNIAVFVSYTYYIPPRPSPIGVGGDHPPYY